MVVAQANSQNEPHAKFYGGIWAGLVPLGVFLILVLGLVMLGAQTTEGMIIAAMVGISTGLFLARDYSVYCERVFSLMANRVATVAIEAMEFHLPIFVGDLISCYTEIIRVGTTSIIVHVVTGARRRDGGETIKVTEGTFIFAALDSEGRPRPVDG